MALVFKDQSARMAPRLAILLPVTLVPVQGSGSAPPLQCSMVDLSDRGVGLKGPLPCGQHDYRLTLQLPEDTRVTMTGRLCWASEGDSQGASRCGFIFLDKDSPERRKLRQFLGQHILDRRRIAGRNVPITIQSDLVQFRNRRGARVVGFYDRPIGESYHPNTPFVVIPPAYGEQKTAALLPAYTFAANGFHVLRYDATNHVGESDGDIQDFTLSQHEEDIHAAIDYLENYFQAYPIAVCAASLGARAALKAASCDPRIQALALLVPVVDLRATLSEVHLEDLVERYSTGHDYGMLNVLGHVVNADLFLENAMLYNFDVLETTLHDCRAIHVPVHVIAGVNDAWVNLESVKQVLENIPSPSKTLYLLDRSMHRLEENPHDLSAAIRHLVAQTYQSLAPNPIIAYRQPSLREIALQRRIEKERAKYSTTHRGVREELAFWESYLSDFTFMQQVDDYQHLAMDITEMITPFPESAVLLDAGCGCGNMTSFFIAEGFPISLYIGIDLVQKALSLARVTSRTALSERPCKDSSQSSVFAFIQGNLDDPLPLRSETVDRIICNLVLSYVSDPLASLRELVRVLKPHGKMVVSTVKPSADFSQIYRNFVGKARTQEQVVDARKLLKNAGGIAVKEADGLYQFFSTTELKNLLETSGIVPLSTRASLGDQAILVSAIKA